MATSKMRIRKNRHYQPNPQQPHIKFRQLKSTQTPTSNSRDHKSPQRSINTTSKCRLSPIVKMANQSERVAKRVITKDTKERE
jgi:hypothetical protein